MRLTKGLMISAIALASVLTLSGCTDSAQTPEAAPVEETVEFEAGTSMAALNEAGAITIGTKFDQPLFGLKGPDNNPVGFDVEIGKLIAAKLGISADKIKWTETVSANREPFLQNGQVDLVVATYTINDTRKEVVDFAGPYYQAGQDLLVLAGNPDKITGPEDLAGKPVCTVSGSTSEKNIAAYSDNVIATDTYSNCLGPLRSGEVVAVTTDNVILAGLADQNAGEFEVVDNPFTKEPYGIGLKKDDTEFRTFINDVLDEAYEDGTWAEAWEATAGTVLETPTPPAVDRY
ncbi:glutamate ABC transporter substrate-binding protein [Cryobacterium sp. TMT1-62]|uniref:Glutamate ABC transporter substrate-binding protein n=1 Tax=Cryobacterium sandaracinum TaxID=1259247 RepID=A0ABY2J3N5_9MICO|nr:MULTISPECIES: glutamate ABC transporter substrate-binding protein [Cryobacterium]TFB55669.1 glutamate ABC transporter substrate-binding protein [Cryobacterium sp. Sr3]TFB61544.1 glutamate ABC transporter substrate-binding protein [Cryobacterium sp. Hz7]TFC35685.1 glutamate ABC transporter substrate-binding protein [Cryobacterium sp. TMT2-14]TFC47602.1 glutamate ABC transporter substrate-binding protein [Cryobacterium sp. TMT2-17-1]TFC64802.1 glutamate ABC transporter substrate-binding prote